MSSLAQPLSRLLDRASPSWRPMIEAWRHTDEAKSLVTHVDARVAAGATVYPAEVLKALELTPLDAVRVVIVGQDPYHGPGQAHGLAFSVPEGVRTPPSLRNIFGELQREFGRAPASTDLSAWARQGVLLLNTSLTVEEGAAASHAGRGWESLTANLIQAVAARPQPAVYLLWGAHAQRFEPLIAAHAGAPDDTLVLKANHPSPLSARRPPVPFVGNGHFGAANAFLASRGGPIDWLA
ncbi:MAG TPA: uracil-DNA glycosylase [Rhizobacter sp.]|nr:uracil-DNA glycosylase [Rhizobacter sp.]